MRRSFKAVFYAIISNPIQIVMLLGYVSGFILFGVTKNFLYIFFLLLYLIPFAVLEKTLPKGHPAILSRKMTPLFYAVQGFTGRYTIIQTRLPEQNDCAVLMHVLTAQQRLLPAALKAAPGKYRAITHDTVIKRLKAIDSVVIERCRPIYVANMSPTLNYLTKKQCRKCTSQCPAEVGRSTPRQFYDVDFTIS